MHTKVSPSTRKAPTWLTQVIWLGVLFLPLALLLLASLRHTGTRGGLLWMGTIFQLLACLLALLSRHGWQEVTGSPTIMLYFIALSWLMLGESGQGDWYYHLALACLMVVPLILFSLHCLHLSGATTLRRARQLADRLARRRTWPDDLMEIRNLPEVKALRENLHLDASPALLLLQSSQVPVRVAGLAALEFRQTWAPGHAEAVLHLARHSQEVPIRASAILALGNTEDRPTLETISEYLWDPAALVRQAAKEAVLWNLEQRWTWIRLPARQALCHPLAQHDGPLCRERQLLPEEVVADLRGWAAEKGLLAVRAAQTLATHYHYAILQGSDPKLINNLRSQLASSTTPTLLRLELARLLFSHRELDEETAWQLIDGSMPAPIRLLAAETLIISGHPLEVTPVLHDLARTPNRELALATAEVVQRCLGVELGLPRDHSLPPIQSRQAAEVARRVLAWTNETDALGQPDAVVIRNEPAWKGPSEG